jgi:hypothetical protein
MTTPTPTPTIAQIAALRTEAAVAGDLDMMRLCNAALAGNPAAIAECAKVIAAGQG